MYPQEIVGTCFEDLMAAMPLMPLEVNADYLMAQYKQATTLASLAWNPSFDPKLERRLERITCPTLIVWGANDRLIKPVYAEAFHQRILDSKLVMLEGTGHMPMFEKVVEWSTAITTFLAGGQGQALPLRDGSVDGLNQKEEEA
jgi:pimeloyl-ACP methyl ester carboxylesterase